MSSFALWPKKKTRHNSNCTSLNYVMILCVKHRRLTGSTPQSDTKENVIFQLLEMIIQFWKKFQKALLNRFYMIQSKWAHIQNSDCTVTLKETLKLARCAFSGFGVLDWLCKFCWNFSTYWAKTLRLGWNQGYFVVDYECIKWSSCKSMYYP